MEESADALRKWAQGEHTDSALDAGFEKWKRENRAELERLELPDGFGGVSAQSLLKQQLDKSGEFATMDTEKLAEAMLAEPEIPDGKIYQFMLKPGAKHNRDFMEAGYTSAADGERLRRDILEKCKDAPMEDIHWDDKYKFVRYSQYIALSSDEHRFKVSYKVEPSKEHPQLITCFRKEV